MKSIREDWQQQHVAVLPANIKYMCTLQNYHQIDSNSVGYTWHQTSNISHILVGYKIVNHSNAVGALAVGAAPTTSSFLT